MYGKEIMVITWETFNVEKFGKGEKREEELALISAL